MSAQRRDPTLGDLATITQSLPRGQIAVSTMPVEPLPPTPPPSTTASVSSATTQPPEQIPPPIFGFKGRLGRLRFLVRFCASLSVPLTAVFFFLDWIHDAIDQPSAAQLMLAGITILVIVSYQLSAIVLRLHDLGQRYWIALFHFIPGLNLIFWLILFLFPGSTSNNQYGPCPRGNSFLTWFTYLLFVLAPLGLIPAAALHYDAYLQTRATVQQK